MPQTNDNEVVLFGVSSFRNEDVNFGIKMDDRRKHMYVIGKSGMGKSELLKNIAIQDIQDGRGLAFIDPHGDPVEDLLDYIPPERAKDVIYINPADMEFPIGFNVMEHVDYDKRHLVGDGMMAVFKKIWVDAWSARMEYILNYTILALLEVDGSTLLGINRMLAEKEYRKSIVDQVKDPEVKAFWTQEFAKYTDKFASEATAAIQNKIGQFVSNPLIRNIVGQSHSSFNVREAMDQQKILLVNISKGRIGEDASRLLGALLITRIQLAAMSRVDIPKHERKDFVLIVDEFQNFATSSFANILSEARKFNLSLVIAHQYVAQMEEEVADAVFGNVGTIISFRVGAEDAEMLEKEFSPEFLMEDIVNLGKYQIYLKLMIDGAASRAFSARTLAPLPMPPTATSRQEVMALSRQQYGRERAQVEDTISGWREPLQTPASQSRPPQSMMPPRNYDDRRDDTRRRAPMPPWQDTRPNPPPRQPVRQELSLGDAFTKGAVDFQGRKVVAKEKRRIADLAMAPLPKKEVDTTELKKLLAEVLGKKAEEDKQKEHKSPQHIPNTQEGDTKKGE